MRFVSAILGATAASIFATYAVDAQSPATRATD
jgi:hypothetical protein